MILLKMKACKMIQLFGLLATVCAFGNIVEGVRCYSCWYDSTYNVGKEWNQAACINTPERIVGVNIGFIVCNDTAYCVTDELYDVVSSQMVTYSRSCSATPRSNNCQMETNQLRCSLSCQKKLCNGNQNGHMYDKFLDGTNAGWRPLCTGTWWRLGLVLCLWVLHLRYY